MPGPCCAALRCHRPALFESWGQAGTVRGTLPHGLAAKVCTSVFESVVMRAYAAYLLLPHASVRALSCKMAVAEYY